MNLPTWHEGVPDALREVLHTPVVIENDVNLAAMAERAGGVAAGLDDFAFVWLGTGLGLAAVINGQVRRGFGGAAGEIGWMPVHGAPLPAGNEHPSKAGLQALAGGLAVQTLAAEHGFDGATPADAITAALADLARARSFPGGARGGNGAAFMDELRTGSRSASRPSASSSTPALSCSAARSARRAARNSPPAWPPRCRGSAWPAPPSSPRPSPASRCSSARCRRPSRRPAPRCSARSARRRTKPGVGLGRSRSEPGAG